MPVNHLENLKAVVELLGPNGENWTQGVAARNSQSIPVGVFDEDACKFCAIGAITYVTNTINWPYSEEMVEFIKESQPVFIPSISRFNDVATWEEIATMFKNAITQAEQS